MGYRFFAVLPESDIGAVPTQSAARCRWRYEYDVPGHSPLAVSDKRDKESKVAPEGKLVRPSVLLGPDTSSSQGDAVFPRLTGMFRV
jgi:hypothetical protein